MFGDADIYILKNDSEYPEIVIYNVGYEELDKILSTFSFIES